jgi:hypothetical protein
MKSYIKLAEKEEHAIFFLLGMGEAKFQFYLLRSMAFVWIFIVISRGQKSF